MIDPKLLRTDPDAVRRSQAARGEDSSVVDDVVAADEARREAIAQRFLDPGSTSSPALALSWNSRCST